jgi:hypothetical protein
MPGWSSYLFGVLFDDQPEKNITSFEEQRARLVVLLMRRFVGRPA